ncbi:MAG: DUF3336 domain-containing protein [Oceanococcus sp.]
MRKDKQLQRDLDNALDYRSWRAAALELDELEGKADWRATDETRDYDFRLIRARLNELRLLREEQRVAELVHALHEGLHGNLGGIASPTLYTHCRVGTKLLIEEYLHEVAICLNYLCDNDFDEFPIEEKIRFFKRTGSSFGRSALMLSGGATLGMFHIGVIKALFSEGVLPRVLSGSSAGSIIAGAVGTRTDEELKDVFNPGGLYLDAFRVFGLRNAMRNRSLMDQGQLWKCLQENMGDYTFEEAFERTRRIVGITVSPIEPHQQGRLLNYLTAPNVTVSRASLASCAIPGVFPPVMLQAKSFKGELVGYMPSKRWQDGTLRSDLPMLRIARLHNVNHYIVSQTNPHVVPFLKDDRARNTSGMVSLVGELARSSYGVYSKHIVETARHRMNPEGWWRVAEKLMALTNQRFSGDVNIFPSQTPKKVLRMLTSPTEEDMRHFIHSGEKRTWPQVERIRNSTVISRTFEDCLQRMKDRGETQRKQANNERVVRLPTAHKRA